MVRDCMWKVPAAQQERTKDRAPAVRSVTGGPKIWKCFSKKTILLQNEGQVLEMLKAKKHKCELQLPTRL